MAVGLTLYGSTDCSLLQKIKMVAKAAGVELAEAHIDTLTKKEMRLPVFREPALETPEGVLGGSNTIVRYIAGLVPNKNLMGRSYFERSQVEYFQEVFTSEIEQNYNSANPDASKILAIVAKLDMILLWRSFLVGERLSVADIHFAAAVSSSMKKGVVAHEQLMAFQNAHRLLAAVFSVVGRPCGGKPCSGKPCDKPCSGKPCDKPCGGKPCNKPCDKPCGGKPCKEEGEEGMVCEGGVCKLPKAAPAPAPAAPASPAAVCDDDDEKPAPKKKNPLDDLAKSSMDFDAWKREYSNTKTEKNLRDSAMKYFWENVDFAGYSFWFIKYDRLPDECKNGLVTSNQLGGFLQRMDNNFRKYSFGVTDVMKADDGYDIEGVWMWRGSEIPAEMQEHPSYDVHKFTRIHPDTCAEDKTKVADYWCAEENIQGREIHDCKVWK